jgi:hypothetical protein
LTVVLGDFFSRWLRRYCCLEIRSQRRHQVHANILDALGVSGPKFAIHCEKLSTPRNTWSKLAVRCAQQFRFTQGSVYIWVGGPDAVFRCLLVSSSKL